MTPAREEIKKEYLKQSPRYSQDERLKLTVVLDGGYFDLLERLCVKGDSTKTNLVRIALDELADKVGRTNLYLD
jgi:hypothetical protein